MSREIIAIILTFLTPDPCEICIDYLSQVFHGERERIESLLFSIDLLILD